jgi:hypothetical protein
MILSERLTQWMSVGRTVRKSLSVFVLIHDVCDAVLHLAGYTSFLMREPSAYEDSNFGDSLHLLASQIYEIPDSAFFTPCNMRGGFRAAVLRSNES